MKSKRKIGGHVSIAGGLINSLDRAEKIGGNCLQIFAASPRSWARSPFPLDQAKEYSKQIETKDLRPVFIHTLYLVNLASDNPEIYDKSMSALKSDMQSGDLIKSAGVVVHLGSHQGRGFDAVSSQVVDSIKKILKASSQTLLLIENSAGQKGKVGSLEEISHLLKQVSSPRLGVCIDTAHLFAAGFDLTQEKKIDELVLLLDNLKVLSHLKCIHLNDSKTALGSASDQHDNIGQGKIGLQGLGHFINHPKLRHLPIILEVPGFSGQGPDKKNIDIVKSLIR